MSAIPIEVKKRRHCLLFVAPEGKPVTEYLPDNHEGRQIYGLVRDPTPEKGRESRHQVVPSGSTTG